MNLQESCEVLEKLLERDASSNRPLLTMKEFNALNKVLFELQVNGNYELPEEYAE